ncbi:hypothetical protein PAMP_000707 [Pampus punctatissimus]
MEFKRRVRCRMYFILLVLGNIVTVVVSGFNNKTGLNLDCTNDMELMTCYFEAQNCNEYNVTVVSNEGHGGKHCIPKQCDTERCCCSPKVLVILLETHTATVWKGNQSVESKIIHITNSIKPNRPTIISVNESNGNFEVTWKTNCNIGTLINTLRAEVTYHKKGDSKEVSKSIKSATVAGNNYFEILGRELEPSTMYLVRVKTYTTISGLFSDSSEAYEFKTPASRNVLLLVVIIILCAAAVIISSAIYYCFVKIKSKWWDTFGKLQNSKILDIHPSKPQVLKTMPSAISSVSVEPFLPTDSKWVKASLMGSSSESLQQSSGISTGSSLISYAKTEPADIIAGVQDALCKAFANISPISPVVTNPLTESNKGSGLLATPYNTYDARADDLSIGSSGFDNKTYSILVPNCSWQTATDSFENQTQADMLCDSAYHPIQGETLTCPEKQAPACLVPVQQVVSSFMSTDMSYQHNVDSGRYSYTENSSLSSISSGTNTTASCDLAPRVENFDEVLSGATKPDGKREEVTICDENPCYNCVPANSHSFPPVDDDYQAFQTLVKQPDILFSEQRSEEEKERLDRCPEKSSTKILQSFLSPVFPDFTNNVQGGQCLSELQRPFFPLISADQSMPVITDSGYQSV